MASRGRSNEKTLTQDGQGHIDEQVDAAARLEKDTQRREDDGEDEFANVAAERGD